MIASCKEISGKICAYIRLKGIKMIACCKEVSRKILLTKASKEKLLKS
jgi:hypothetical protein